MAAGRIDPAAALGQVACRSRVDPEYSTENEAMKKSPPHFAPSHQRPAPLSSLVGEVQRIFRANFFRK
jgi:hypothetical protein